MSSLVAEHEVNESEAIGRAVCSDKEKQDQHYKRHDIYQRLWFEQLRAVSKELDNGA